MMKSTLLAELQRSDFPELSLFQKPEALAVLPALLNELLEQERADFHQLLQKTRESLTFEDFVEASTLDYLRTLLNQLDSLGMIPGMRQIISDFRPQYEDFTHEIAYSQDYYQLLLSSQAQFSRTSDQKRWFELQIKAYQQRGIALSPEDQHTLKELNKQLSALGEEFEHHVVDEQSAFLFRFLDASALAEMPASFLKQMENLAGEA